jgi:cyclophilin family peptidyl-prolyl cis-trans isomerase/HEAT repeat protein
VLRDAGVSPVLFAPGSPRTLLEAADAALDVLSVDHDPGIRRRAVLALGRVGMASGVPALVSALHDSVEDVRATAAFALGLIGADAKDATKPLETVVLSDASAVVRTRAIEGLGLIGDAAAVPAIFQAAKACPTLLVPIAADDESAQSADVELCKVALFALVRLRSYDAIAGLVLSGPGQPAFQWWPGAYALQRINDPRAAPALLALATTPGVNTAGFALRGLAALKDPGALSIARGLAIKRDADIKVRIAAVRALGQLGGAPAATALQDVLAQPGLPVNLVLETVIALGAAGQATSFDLLLDVMTDSAPSIRAAAIASAAKVAPDAFLVILATSERDRDWSVRAALAGVLATLPRERVVPAITSLADDEDMRVRAAGLQALATVKAPTLTSRLFAALEAADFVERATAARLVGETKPEGGIPRLVAAYDRAQSDQAYTARAAALEALAKYGGDQVMSMLRRGLGDREWAVRWRTAELLRGLGDMTAAPERPAPTHFSPSVFTSPAILNPPYSPHAFIDTAHGSIELELNVIDAPLTTANFIELARKGFFNNVAFHRIVPDFVVQGGDPRGDGEGGPGYTIRDELNERPYLRGTVGMALDWRDTGGSQFFIALSPAPHLDARYTVFGTVVDGMEVADRLLPWDVIRRVRIRDGVNPE